MCQARDGLVRAGLIAFEAPLYQVLSLEEPATGSIGEPALPAPGARAAGELRAMRAILEQTLGARR